MLKITPQALLQFDPLDNPSDFEPLPPKWTGGHCALRLCEGFKTLRQLPIRGAPLGFKNSYWVAYSYEWQDLLAQAEGEAEALKVTQRSQNRVRVQPSLQEVTRCEAVIGWSAQYLRAFDHLCEAVNIVALAHSLGRDAGWCTRKRGGYADTWRQRHDKGCAIIATGLIRDRVPVF
jgi:hypothetical protein